MATIKIYYIIKSEGQTFICLIAMTWFCSTEFIMLVILKFKAEVKTNIEFTHWAIGGVGKDILYILHIFGLKTVIVKLINNNLLTSSSKLFVSRMGKYNTDISSDKLGTRVGKGNLKILHLHLTWSWDILKL